MNETRLTAGIQEAAFEHGDGVMMGFFASLNNEISPFYYSSGRSDYDSSTENSEMQVLTSPSDP